MTGEIGRLRDDPGALAAMRAAAIRLGRPDAAARAAAVLATLACRAGGQAEPATAGGPGGSLHDRP